MKKKRSLLIVGADGSSHIGGSLLRGARHLGHKAELADISSAWRPRTVAQKLFWYWDRRPIALGQFSKSIVEKCAEIHPDVLIATGAAPVAAQALEQCRKLGVKLVNFSTDDPLNPRQRGRWFLNALGCYDIIFTPRYSNIDQLRQAGARSVEYLPFGYDPHLFYPPGNTGEIDRSDLFFAGMADDDRWPYLKAAINAGFDVRLHGIRWDRYPNTRKAARGHADLATLRAGIAGCRVALCLVRHENRDGHSMRSFEVPAVGACMVVENTAEHRAIFGNEGERVVYFSSPAEMVERTRELLNDALTRCRLRDGVHTHITTGKHTYTDRLHMMLSRV